MSLLTGRKRFIADVKAMTETSERRGCVVHGLEVKGFKGTDEEGAFQCDIAQADGQHFVALSFLISDTSDYPTRHTFLCYTSEEGHTDIVQRAIQTVHEGKPCTIEDMLNNLLGVFAGKAASPDASLSATASDESEDQDDMGQDEEYSYAYDDMSDIEMGLDNSADHEGRFDASLLKRDFQATAKEGYRPGFIRYGPNEHIISVSIPIVALARAIPLRALMAWDRRLLMRTQYLTLLISNLRGTWPILGPDGTVVRGASSRDVLPRFKVGLARSYKPDKEMAVDAVREFVGASSAERLYAKSPSSSESYQHSVPTDSETKHTSDEDEDEDEDGHFQSFSLTAPLESLLNNQLLLLLQLRLEHDLGWAGAEVLLWEAEKLQMKPRDVYYGLRAKISEAEREDAKLAQTYNLPSDPLLAHTHGDYLNLPLLAFSYLLRRLMLCPRYCIVCHNKLNVDYETLKPYVCDSKLCSYQYYNLEFGPSLQHEIFTNTAVVDLLVSLTYVAAAEGALLESLPLGLGIRLKPRNSIPYNSQLDEDGMCDLDALSSQQIAEEIVHLINLLPAIADIKRFIERNGRNGRKVNLRDMSSDVPAASWLILRWCVASCTALLEELKSEEDLLQNISPTWKQFRFSIGAPDAEARFDKAIKEAQQESKNALQYPSLYAFHGSPVKNWRSIIDHGLWFKTIANGRAHGHGVYFAKEGSYSMGHYSGATYSSWCNSAIRPLKCVVVAEIVNLPSKFVSSNPFFVVDNTEWILCRYLLVDAFHQQASGTQLPTDPDKKEKEPIGNAVPLVRLDPKHPLTLQGKAVAIPDPSNKLEKLYVERDLEYVDEENDEEDAQILGCYAVKRDVFNTRGAAEDDWIHDEGWVKASIETLMPPPVESSPMAASALQRELKAMLKEQNSARSLKELGWYMPPDFIGDNLFQWIVELHSFEENLPITKDMRNRKVNSLIFEIRFPPSFPHSPPFFRILKPRFLPFIQGGGGHVTAGGSMCMDLLTADGWLPSYSIPAILLQIRLAISNLEPRPARLASNWDQAYGMTEALEGFKRAAATHGWKIPPGMERML